MKKNKFAIKIFTILILSLTLTAGYAQALPDSSSYGYKSTISTSYYNLIASKLSGIFGNIPAWGIHRHRMSHLSCIFRRARQSDRRVPLAGCDLDRDSGDTIETGRLHSNIERVYEGLGRRLPGGILLHRHLCGWNGKDRFENRGDPFRQPVAIGFHQV